MFPAEWIDAAAERIAPYIDRTPVTYDSRLGLYLKWENHQRTGSFKVRGAYNKVLTLEPWEREAGLVAASAGNHGQGVALAANSVGATLVVFTPRNAPAVKIEAMRALGADVRLVEGGYEAAEIEGLRFAHEQNRTWASAYNDPQVIAGQGTIGSEISEQTPLTSEMTVLIPVGGGGLLAGIATALARGKQRPRIIGVQPSASAFMRALLKTGSQEGVPDLPSLADGLTGAVEPGSLTIALVRALAEDILLVEEDEISVAIAYAWRRHGEVIEGSGAVGLAAILSGKVKGPAVAVVSGGNIQPELHAQVLARHPEISG